VAARTGPGVARGPLAPLFGSAPPALGAALRALRWAYAGSFLAQSVLALAVGLGLSAVLGARPRPNDVVALVLLGMAVVHVVLGVALGYALAGRPGRAAALAAAVATAVALSVPAWFAALMVVSSQRTPFLAGIVAVLALAYVAGFALTPRCARAALLPAATPAGVPPAAAGP